MGWKQHWWNRSRALWAASLCGVLVCVLASPAAAFDPLSGDYRKDHPLDVRIMAYNTHGDFIADPSRDAAFNRVLVAINPDLICFEEIPSSLSQTQIANRLNSIMPIGGAGWQIHFGLLGGIRNVLASRYPLLLKRTDTIPASSTRGVTLALADLPDADYDRDVYLLGVHLRCCGDPGGSEDASRQDSADAMANWLADARGVVRPSGDNIALPADTPMIALGDFNLVGGPAPETTLITGDIQQEAQYGPDVKGDWDVSDMTNLNPLDPFTGDNFTWQGSASFDPSPLDRMFITDSVFTVANSFVLNSNTMTPAALAAAGLQANDTLPSSTSDHLPIVMDLRLASTPECTSDPQCDDGIFCNGAETCVGDTCQPGTPVDCDDGVSCTVDACNEATDACDHAASNGLCDNGLFCDGAETCNAMAGCQAGGDPCPGQFCDEGADACVECLSNSHCDDGVFCNGAETCVSGACQAATSPCAGTWCDEAASVCRAYGNGDFEPDGDVDLVDFAMFQGCFGRAAGPACFAGNLVGADGMIDLADLEALVDALGGP